MDKIFITGAGGFIGSHLVEKCFKLGYKVKAFIRYNSMNSWGWLEATELKDKIEVFSGDIRDYESVLDAMSDCQVVIHLAALIGIPYSYISPGSYIRTNVEGTFNVLQAAKKLDVKNILITSTSETYGTAQYTPIDERHPVVGQSPYSASKIAADQLATSYYSSFNMPIKIVRPFNVFGPRQSARAIIPSIIVQILNEKKKIKIGNITPTRDLTYVKDTVNGFIEIMNSKSLVGEITNIGTNIEISIKELAFKIADLMNKKIELISDEQRIRPENSEVQRLICNNKKILEFTKWKLHYSLEAGLEETIKWFKQNLNLYKSELYHV